MPYRSQNYREFLKAVFFDRSQKRSLASLSGFAKRIGVSTSFLSEVLASKKSISMKMAFKIAFKLNLTDLETRYFCLLVQVEHEKDPIFKEELLHRLKSMKPERAQLDVETRLFRLISDWYHFGILEMTYLPDFRLETKYISQKMGITEPEARVAIERLKKLKLLKQDPNGKCRKAYSSVIAESKIPDSAHKLHHKQILKLATESIDQQTPAQRMSATDIVSFDSRFLPEVDRLSREFSSAVIKLAEKSKTKDSVYSLSVHFFKLTQEPEEL